MSIPTHKPYDNRPVLPGEVLVPMMAFEDRITILGADKKNIVTWTTGGKSYPVMFYPVPIEFEKEAKQQFNQELNEFLGAHRDARCLIPQEDGSFKICPKKNGDNRPACKECPHKHEYAREKKAFTSWDDLSEHNCEEKSQQDDLNLILLMESLDDLLQQLERINPHYAAIVRLGFSLSSNGHRLGKGDYKELLSKTEQHLNVKKSRAYQLISEAEKALKEILY